MRIVRFSQCRHAIEPQLRFFQLSGKRSMRRSIGWSAPSKFSQADHNMGRRRPQLSMTLCLVPRLAPARRLSAFGSLDGA
jgi:hypothetical protein